MSQGEWDTRVTVAGSQTAPVERWPRAQRQEHPTWQRPRRAQPGRLDRGLPPRELRPPEPADLDSHAAPIPQAVRRGHVALDGV